jgi:hypothetical protein
MLRAETESAICKLNAPTAIEDTKMTAINLAAPSIRGRATIVSTLKMLLDNGIVMSLQVFHACIINNEQDWQIGKATVEPSLDRAAAPIAAVVEAERPANQSTLKGLIQDDVNKTTEELRRRVQSLAAKLGKSNVKKSKAAKKGMGNDKKKKKLGTAIAPHTTTPTTTTSKTPRSTRKKSPATMKKTTKKKPTSPAANNNASNAAKKKSRNKATTCKSGGKGQRRLTTARKWCTRQNGELGRALVFSQT